MSPRFLVFNIIMAAALGIACGARGEEPAMPFSLSLPVACTPGADCWIVNYPDADPAAGTAADYRCGALSYDGHDGTDFGLPDMVAMEEGKNIIAPAPGKVLRVRDGIDDAIPSAEDLKTLAAEKKGCGNGVIVDHGGGWQTAYCHMKKNSVKVKQGAEIKAGAVLGQIGHSGMAEFPHLHFSVYFENNIIDPFTALPPAEGCGKTGAPLWDDSARALLSYEPVSFYAAGFATSPPDFEALKIDTHTPATVKRENAEALVFWTALYGVQKDDRVQLRILRPDGSVFATRDIVQDAARARQFYFAGRKAADNSLQPGRYEATATITRTLPDESSLTRDIRRDVIIEGVAP